MNALVTSVLLLLSASDKRLPPPSCGRRRSADPSTRGWNTGLPEGSEVCARKTRAGQVAVCRACFRD